MNYIPEISLHTLNFHVTSVCNLRCSHCWQRAELEDQQDHKDEKRGIISQTVYERVLRESKGLGLTCVKFTGGEPFLHPYIMDYLMVTEGEELSIVIETNGTVLDEGYVGKLKNIGHLLVAVSLDGATSSTHDRFRGVDGAYERVLSALECLARFEIPVQIIMSLHRDNVDSLDGIVKLSSDYGVQSIKINPVQPMGRGQDLVQAGDSLPVAELLQAAEYCRKRLDPSFQGELLFSLPLAFRPFSEIRDQKFSVCRIFQILGLMPNGDISFCGIGNIARSMVIGNIFRDNLADLWCRAPLLLDLRRRLPYELKGICARCILKASCLGECRALAYEQTGDLMGTYWICQQAYEAGLFPESRLTPDSAGLW